MHLTRKPAALRILAALLALTLACAPLLPVRAAGLAPVAENMHFDTFRDVPISGVLAALDPEGEKFTFSVVSLPRKGTLALAADGSFTYTPMDGRKGRDSFTYTATDTAGNVSAPATVTVDIRRQATSVSYADMEGHSARYAALCLAEKGIFRKP